MTLQLLKYKTMAQYTLTFSEDVKGWTSFWSFMPDGMIKLGNTFYSLKNGQLFRHNEEMGIQNNFYGEQYSSKIKTVINEVNAEDKIFKTIVLEGNNAWNVKVNTNYSESTISATEFNKRESRFFSYIRKNEDSNDLHGNTVQGIGTISSIAGTVITFNKVSDFLSVGDQFYQLNGSANELIGMIADKTTTTVTIYAIITPPIVGLFCFSKKNSRIEGSEIRGYYLAIDMENVSESKVELFAVSSETIKSYI